MIIIMFGLFSSFTYGTGALAGAGAMLFTFWIGWFSAPTIFVTTISFLSVFLKWGEGRQGVVT